MKPSSYRSVYVNRGVRALGLLTAALLFSAMGVPSSTQAQEFPSKPFKMIVAFGPGGSGDTLARLISQSITEQTGKPVVVDNLGGANGFIAARAIATAAPDGHTMILTSQGTQVANPAMLKELPYDPVKDLAPVSAVMRGGLVMVVRKDLPVNSVAELTALAKAQPGKLTFASASTTTRVGSELYLSISGAKMVNVNYRSAAQAMTDVINGSVDMLFVDLVPALEPIKTGRVKPLAVSTMKRNESLPDLPTMIEAGVPGFDFTGWLAVYAPGKTPRPILDKLSAMVNTAMASPRLVELSKKLASEPIPGTPDDLAQLQARELALWERIVKEAGIEKE